MWNECNGMGLFMNDVLFKQLNIFLAVLTRDVRRKVCKNIKISFK